MQKRRCRLRIFLLILISIYSGHSKHCNAQVQQDNLYLEFEQLIQDKQKAKAIEIGHDLFEGIVSKYPGNVNLHDLQRRLEAAHDLTELITKGLEFGQKKVLSDIANLDISPELPSIDIHDKEYICLLPPAHQLYLTNLQPFSQKLNIQGISPNESRFLHQYYNLRMQSWIEKVANITAQVIITNPRLSGLSYYSFVLPLLYMSEQDAGWGNPDFLFTMIGSDNLDAISDFCLLRAERPKTAIAIAKYKAKSESRSLSLVDWSISASDRCVKNHRPDLAEKLLRTAIDDISDKNRIVELRLKIAENFSKSGDNARAVEECGQIAKDFPASSLYGKVMSLYFAYLARQSEAEKILAEIDPALKTSQCQRYLPQLMYLKWWALRKTNQQILANKFGEQLIEDYGNNPCIAPVLLAHASDALSNQRYDQCRKLLLQLIRDCPQTNSAKQAQKILNHLGKK